MEKASPLFIIRLIQAIIDKLFNMFDSSKYKSVEAYIIRWQEPQGWEGNYLNFEIHRNNEGNIDLFSTLSEMPDELIIKIAINLGLETPDFIPAIPVFRNNLKSSYQRASENFEEAFHKIEENPKSSVGLANSTLESIIKEILKDERFETRFSGNKSLQELTKLLMKEFQLMPNSNLTKEINTIGSSLLGISKAIEDLRSDKTNFHGKTDDDYVIEDSLYAYFIVNATATIGLFLKSYYEKKYPKIEDESIDGFPF